MIRGSNQRIHIIEVSAGIQGVRIAGILHRVLYVGHKSSDIAICKDSLIGFIVLRFGEISILIGLDRYTYSIAVYISILITDCSMGP